MTSQPHLFNWALVAFIVLPVVLAAAPAVFLLWHAVFREKHRQPPQGFEVRLNEAGREKES